jgi:hypothetical protein
MKMPLPERREGTALGVSVDLARWILRVLTYREHQEMIRKGHGNRVGDTTVPWADSPMRES